MQELRAVEEAGGATPEEVPTINLCMPNDPDYLRYTPGVQGFSNVYGVEYELWGRGPFRAVHHHNAPCAVCYASTRVHCKNKIVVLANYLVTTIA